MGDTKEIVYSFSKLNSFDQCPYGWYLSYIEHSPQVNNAFSSYGTFVHELCEKYALGEYPLDSLADMYEWGFDEAVPEEFPPNKYTDLRQSYYDSGLKFLKSWQGYAGCKILGVEEHFKIDIEDIKFQGFIDISFIDLRGRYILRDYKSHKKYSKTELLTARRQPYLYALYFYERYGRYPDALQFYTFRNEENRVVEIEFNERDMNEAIRWAVDTAHRIESEWAFEKKPDMFFCMNLCGHRENCPYGES